MPGDGLIAAPDPPTESGSGALKPGAVVNSLTDTDCEGGDAELKNVVLENACERFPENGGESHKALGMLV